MTVLLCRSSLNHLKLALSWFRWSLLSLRIHAVHLFLRLERPSMLWGEAVICGIASIVLLVVVSSECKTTCSGGLLAPPSCGLALPVWSHLSLLVVSVHVHPYLA